MIMNKLPKLGRAEWDELQEIAHFPSSFPLWWTRAPIQTLIAHGYVEAAPECAHYTQPPMRLTAAGRAKVAEITNA
jgi:hypothetical protein